MKIPLTMTAGDSVSWDDLPSTDNLGNSVDSATWTLKYELRQASVTNITLTGTANGTGWRTTITQAQSTTYSPGIVYWQAYAEKTISGTVNRVTLGSGQINMLRNLAAAANTAEFRSQTQQDLEAVQLAMRTMISGGAVQEYTIHGRSLRKISLAELRQLEAVLKGRLNDEKAAEAVRNGLPNPKNVFVRFGGK